MIPTPHPHARHTPEGLSGVGDTFGTCFGPLSRNRNLGVRLGKGESLDAILGSSTEVAEGVATAFSLVQLIEKTNRAYRKELSFPIIYGVKEILEGKRTPAEGLRYVRSSPRRLARTRSHLGMCRLLYAHVPNAPSLSPPFLFPSHRDLMALPVRVEMWNM